MKIGIIGAGWLGGTVGRVWVQAGHQVLFSSRHPEKQQRVAAALGSLASGGTVAEAAAFGEVVLISVPYRALEALGQALETPLAGKIVLDACNPYGPDPAALIRQVEADGVAQTSARLLPGVRLVRAFSAVDATAIEASAAGRGERLGVPLASNDPEAMQIAEQLVRDAGCDPVAAGDLVAARRFQRGGAGFRAHLGAAELRRALGLH
ncbi:MAG TPA: NAD(P)-binding domain-containing protein [Caulobacteraceae bacterium]